MCSRSKYSSIIHVCIVLAFIIFLLPMKWYMVASVAPQCSSQYADFHSSHYDSGLGGQVGAASVVVIFWPRWSGWSSFGGRVILASVVRLGLASVAIQLIVVSLVMLRRPRWLGMLYCFSLFFFFYVCLILDVHISKV